MRELTGGGIGGACRVVADADACDDDADVVAAAALVRHPHQLVDDLGRVGQTSHRGGDLIVGHLVEQTVAAQQVQVVEVDGQLPVVDLEVVTDARAPG